MKLGKPYIFSVFDEKDEELIIVVKLPINPNYPYSDNTYHYISREGETFSSLPLDLLARRNECKYELIGEL